LLEQAQALVKAAIDTTNVCLGRSRRCKDQVRREPNTAASQRIATAPGVGLSVIRRRLQLQYGDRATFRVDTAPGQGFRVTLTLPATKEEAA